jgi:ABC-type multidrug transport system ATPase subunit
MDTLIRVEHLSKQFKEVKAVDDLSFAVHKGEVYGFLGQNGAGKSTTIRMLLTLVLPTEGRIQIFGKELQQYRLDILRNTGAIIERPDLYNYLTALENLQIMAKLSGIDPTRKELLRRLEMVGIASRAHSKVKTFSQGMKQRLGIACALIHDPQLIILDEPTNGLDPQGIADVRNLILHLSKEEGKTLVVSSHLLHEVELIADSMLIIDKGRKVAEGQVAALLNPKDTMVEVKTLNDHDTLQHLQQSRWATQLQTDDHLIMLKMDKNEIPDLARFLIAHGAEITGIQSRHSLEDYFLSQTSGSNVAIDQH